MARTIDKSGIAWLVLAACGIVCSIGSAADESADIAAAVARLDAPKLDDRIAAVNTLLRAGSASPHAIEALISALRRDHDLDHQLAAGALFQAAPAVAPDVQELISAVGGEDRIARSIASYRLAQLGPGAAAAVDALTACLDHPDKHVRNFAAVTLGMIGPAARPAVPALIRAMKSPDTADMKFQYVRASVAWALGALRADTPEVRAVLTAAVADPIGPSHPRHDRNCAEIRAAASYALGRLGNLDPATRAVLTQAAAAEDPMLHHFAGRALALSVPDAAMELPSPGGVNPVLPLLAAIGPSARSVARDSATLAVAYLTSPEGLRQVADLKPMDPKAMDEKRHAAVAALGGINREVTPVLLTAIMLRQDNAGIRAIDAVDRSAPPGTAEKLHVLLGDTDWLVRLAAAEALQRLSP